MRGPIGLLLALAVAAAAEARPPKPPRPAPEKPATRIDVRIIENGEVSEIHLDGARLKGLASAGAVRWESVLTDGERARLSIAARAALRSEWSRAGCSIHEVIVTVTIDGASLWTALCDTNRPENVAAWRSLVEVTRAVAAPPAKGSVTDGGA
ncbi:MAG: hypothetical protein EXR72_13910 [Myxococcales bacterium]|nr:hypothetical protein [Myxococcales bacterium]